jgi:Domain of unknown function (DUF1911)/Domain of unknown function (DUF1910)
MRDKIGNLNLFRELINDNTDSTARLVAGLSYGKVASDRVNSIKEAILNNYLDSCNASYSLGLDKMAIKELVNKAISSFADSFQWAGFENHYGGYDQMIWVISLAILCDVSDDDFKRITTIIERDKVQDKLLDFLIKSKLSDWKGSSDSFIQESPYKGLQKALNEPAGGDAGIKLIQQYLQKDWYKGHSDAAWYNSHLNKKVNVYCGYWAWETAALVKAKGWDDEKLKGLDYYPYDAAHW